MDTITVWRGSVHPHFHIPCETHAAELCSLERFWVPFVQLPELLYTSTANKVVCQADNREEVIVRNKA